VCARTRSEQCNVLQAALGINPSCVMYCTYLSAAILSLHRKVLHVWRWLLDLLLSIDAKQC
jgi:hypothetical protein